MLGVHCTNSGTMMVGEWRNEKGLSQEDKIINHLVHYSNTSLSSFWCDDLCIVMLLFLNSITFTFL